MNHKSVSRISSYRTTLLRLKTLGYRRTYSNTLADAVGVTAVQVRKDFSTFGISGNKKGGYPVDKTLDRLNAILIKDTVQQIVVVGAGNIGRAVLNFHGFKSDGMHIVAGFDIDPQKTGKECGGVPVFPLDDLAFFVRSRGIRLSILCVPDYAAQHTADLMVNAGIKGILNFAPIKLSLPRECIINNVSLEHEFEKIIYLTSLTQKAAEK